MNGGLRTRLVTYTFKFKTLLVWHHTWVNRNTWRTGCTLHVSRGVVVCCPNRPIPVPTLDEFILLHKALQRAVQAQPGMLGLLRGAKRSFGWNVLGARPPDALQSPVAIFIVLLHRALLVLVTHLTLFRAAASSGTN